MPLLPLEQLLPFYGSGDRWLESPEREGRFLRVHVHQERPLQRL